jgi:hypothetical protein
MSTNAQIAGVLKESAEARALALEHDVHTLMGKLKAWYESVHGKIAADLADWHWHATTLKNQVTGETDADKSSATPGNAGSEPQPDAPSDADNASATPGNAPDATAPVVETHVPVVTDTPPA